MNLEGRVTTQLFSFLFDQGLQFSVFSLRLRKSLHFMGQFLSGLIEFLFNTLELIETLREEFLVSGPLLQGVREVLTRTKEFNGMCQLSDSILGSFFSTLLFIE